MTKDQINAAIELEKDAPDLVELQERRDFCDYWPLIKKILLFARKFTGPAIDAAIDVIVRWGDSKCPR